MRGFLSLVKRESFRFLRVANNTVVPPLVSSLLYLIIFGVALGARISNGDAQAYLEFLIPGLIMMNIVMGSYSNPSGSLFLSRLLGFINDVLLSSLSYLEIVASYVIGGIARGLILGLGTWAIGLFFAPVGIMHPLLWIAYAVLTSVTFACLGIIMGLWADRNDQLNLLVNFVITPLVFLGGVFYSIETIPPALQQFTYFNPLFYMVSGLRYSMIGVQESSITLGLSVLAVIAAGLLTLCVYLFKRGWNLRD